jgi:hypothetical protein
MRVIYRPGIEQSRDAVKVVEVTGLDLGRILIVIEVLHIPPGRMTRSSFEIDQQGVSSHVLHI